MPFPDHSLDLHRDPARALCSDERCPPRQGHRLDRQGAHLVLRRAQVELRGVHRPVPLEGAAGVGAHASHHAGHGGLGEPNALVDRLALADAADERRVHLQVAARPLAVELPGPLARDGGRPAVDVGGALRAVDHVADAGADAALLRRHGEHGQAVRVLVAHREVVEDVAELRPRPHLPTAEALADHRRLSRDPVHHVEVVDQLLDVVVPGQPREERPAADLPLHVAPRRLAVVVVPQLHVADPERLEVGQLSDLSVPDPLDELEVLGRVALLGAHDEGQALLGGPPGRLDERPHSHRVDRARLLDEQVLARLHGGRDHLGAEARGGQQHDQVDVVEGEDLLVGVEPQEDALGRDLDLARDLLAQLRESRVDLVREEVGDGHELDTGRRLEAVDGIGRAALAAADDGHADRVRARGEDTGRGKGKAHPRHRHRLAEIPARQGVARARHHDDLLDSRARARGAGARGTRLIMSWPPSRYHPGLP